MNATDKVALHKLSVLELAQSLGNVTEACRQRGVSRTQFYEYKRRFQTHGIEGLKDLPPVHKTHPFTTPPETVKRILALSLEHPGWGCIKLSSMLKLEEINVSSPTIQNILIKNNMGSIYERMLKLEEKAAQKAIELTPEQVAQIEKYNPCFRERHVESSRPGELLSQDTFYVGTLKGVGRVYLHAVVDTYSSYAFGFLHTSKQPEAAARPGAGHGALLGAQGRQGQSGGAGGAQAHGQGTGCLPGALPGRHCRAPVGGYRPAHPPGPARPAGLHSGQPRRLRLERAHPPRSAQRQLRLLLRAAHPCRRRHPAAHGSG